MSSLPASHVTYTTQKSVLLTKVYSVTIQVEKLYYHQWHHYRSILITLGYHFIWIYSVNQHHWLPKSSVPQKWQYILLARRFEAPSSLVYVTSIGQDNN